MAKDASSSEMTCFTEVADGFGVDTPGPVVSDVVVVLALLVIPLQTTAGFRLSIPNEERDD